MNVTKQEKSKIVKHHPSVKEITYSICYDKITKVSHMSNIHKQIRFVKPMVYWYQWYDWYQ